MRTNLAILIMSTAYVDMDNPMSRQLWCSAKQNAQNGFTLSALEWRNIRQEVIAVVIFVSGAALSIT